MIIAHLADLHVSKYGTKMTAIKNGRIISASGSGWQVCWQEAGWRIDQRQFKGAIRKNRELRLVDHENRVHRKVKQSMKMSEHKLINELIMLKNIREKTSSQTLADHWPTDSQLQTMLEEDPDNGNIRFCAVANALCKDNPDWVVVTGDLTDDGVGYELIKTGLQPFIQSRRLICIPGNHDLYPTPPIWTSNALRKSIRDKKVLWADFVQHLELPNQGSYVVALDENVLLAYFDSLHPGQLPGSSSGHLPIKELKAIKKQMDRLNPEAIKLACLHHPILNMSLKELGLINYQPGMKLRNSKKVLDNIKQMGFAAVMKGHRHVGYKYHMQDGPIFLSAPSTTYGCRSGAKPFYWKIDIKQDGIKSIKKNFIPMLAEKGLCTNQTELR